MCCRTAVSGAAQTHVGRLSDKAPVVLDPTAASEVRQHLKSGSVVGSPARAEALRQFLRSAAASVAWQQPAGRACQPTPAAGDAAAASALAARTALTARLRCSATSAAAAVRSSRVAAWPPSCGGAPLACRAASTFSIMTGSSVAMGTHTAGAATGAAADKQHLKQSILVVRALAGWAQLLDACPDSHCSWTCNAGSRGSGQPQGQNILQAGTQAGKLLPSTAAGSTILCLRHRRGPCRLLFTGPARTLSRISNSLHQHLRCLDIRACAA